MIYVVRAGNSRPLQRERGDLTSSSNNDYRQFDMTVISLVNIIRKRLIREDWSGLALEGGSYKLRREAHFQFISIQS